VVLVYHATPGEKLALKNGIIEGVKLNSGKVSDKERYGR
jgi:hypothetical protein